MTTTLITGANRGIGLELCRLAADRDDEVIAVCRTRSDALTELDVRVIDGVDVSTDDGVSRLVEAVGDTPIDILINNAGVLRMDRLDALKLDDLRLQLEVNAIGPLRVSAALSPCLREGSKLAIITSRMGSIADNSSGGQYGYRMSKAAVNAAGVSLARDLAGGKVAVVLLHPGWIRTEMTGNMGNTGPDEAAAQLLARIDELTLETTGRFVHANGESLPW